MTRGRQAPGNQRCRITDFDTDAIDEPSDGSRAKAESNPRRSANASQGGAGPGAGRSDSRAAPMPVAHPAGSDASSSSIGQPAGGSGATSPASIAGENAGVAGAPLRRVDQVPPWQSQSWPADAARASDALHHGGIPDAYRDLVRDYFAR